MTKLLQLGAHYLDRAAQLELPVWFVYMLTGRDVGVANLR